jgi:hypothetical protein
MEDRGIASRPPRPRRVMTAENPPDCPKCGHRAPPGAESCRRCGLTFALWNPAPGDPLPVLRLDERGDTLWAEVLADWSDPARHDAFLKHCSVAGLLGVAGRRYRQRLDEQPADPVAGRMQARVLEMATAAFVRTPTAAVPVTRNTWFWLVLVACGVVGMVGAMLLRR